MLVVFAELAVAESESKVWRIREFSGVFLLLSAFFLAVYAKFADSYQEIYRSEIARIHVSPPATPPKVSQESIDLALMFYGIEVPKDADHPTLEQDLADRGVTIKPAYFGKTKVNIGPSAFASWALLGSTLAHELEIHCVQSFFAVWVLDLLGLRGTELAERRAYVFELENKNRFGLNLHERAMITETLDFYYPDELPAVTDNRYQQLVAVRKAQVNRWLARNLIGPSSR
jgi:hypothetical protein